MTRAEKLFTPQETSYMRRALKLATYGMGRVSPNPFVGAVIVAGGRIIGEGYHRIFGGPHAEVNAVNSVAPADRELLKESTLYVTLEPCSHFGKTPPCALLVTEKEIPDVVVASTDPFLKNHESGIEIMRRAGVNVRTGLLEKESNFLNRRFLTAHTLRRPFVLLKWAVSADGFIGTGIPDRRLRLSTPVTEVLMHRERSLFDAIMAGTSTVVCDNPRLDCRLWPCRNAADRPVRLSYDSSRITPDLNIRRANHILKPKGMTLPDFLNSLYEEHGITSVMVEGGRETLQEFIDLRLFDEVRIETSPVTAAKGVKAPDPTAAMLELHMKEMTPETYGSNVILRFVKNY